MKSPPPNKDKPAIMKGTADLESSAPVIKSKNLFPVVGIGASAGGLNAFKKLLKAIPENSGMAYVLVQHLDPNHESLLPEILQKVTRIPVLEISHDIKVEPDHIYVIPSNKMMVATDGVLLLTNRPPKSNTERNRPIDLFFNSLAEVHREQAIGVVLSGTASDGTQGLRAIKDMGGLTFAQDEASAEYEGMPHSAAEAGVVDFILPPEEIPRKLLEVTSKIALSDEEVQNIPQQDEDVFKQILSLLRIRKGVDFTYYKQTTVRRRILRRMVVNKNEEPAEYLKFLRGNNPEQDLLYLDMLIPVTSFFRDKKTFENLCTQVFPTILKNKIHGEITRIWVAGCSTGQEAYSFAICFKEFLEDQQERIQIFGTDLSEPAITKARTGLYEKTEMDGVSPKRLQEFFTKNDGGYLINKNIRDMCVFAHHNFLKDPPFGKMDVITCRNVLIYMEPYLQKKALTTFHYALNPKRFLLLGKSETTSAVPDLFASATKTDKLFTRKDVPGRFIQVTSQRSEQILSLAGDYSKIDPDKSGRTDFQKTADDILLSKYTPAGVVVNETMDIVHFRGNTGNYLEQAPGKPSHNLFMMAKHGLGFELRNIVHKAKTGTAPVVKENIPLHVNGTTRNISIEAVPLPNTREPYYLVLFHDQSLNDTDRSVISNKRKASAKTLKDEKDNRIQLLEQELSQAREDMRSITEEQEAVNEELQSANEELLSSSEELQSLNEELETSKEELQSTNEELTILNHELINVNEQITDARNYSQSIVATLYQPLLVMDKNLRVKSANKAFYKTFRVNEGETEGVLVYDLGNRQWNIPELRTLLEEILPEKKQIKDFEVTHNFLSIGERVILLSALEITREKKEEKLILLSIEDITEKKEAEEELRKSEEQKAYLLKLNDAMRSLSNPVDIEEAITKIAMDFMDADRCHYSTIEGDNVIILQDATRGDLPTVAGVHPISRFPLYKALLNAGRPFVVDDVRTTNLLDEDLTKVCLQFQYGSFINVPVIKNGKPVGLLSLVQSKPRIWTDSEVQLSVETAERTWAAVERAKAEEALRKSEEQLSYDLTNAKKLQAFSTQLIHEENIDLLYEQLIDAAITLMRSDMASIQLYHPEKKQLQLLAHKGYHPASAAHWEWVSTDSQSACSAALNKGERCIISDVEKDKRTTGTGNLHYYQLSGIRAVQSTPLIARNGNLLGMISTLWREPHQPSERDLQLFDVLARQAADLIERKKSEEKIAQSEKRYHNMIYSSPSLIAIFKGEDMIIDIANNAILESWGKGKDIIGQPLISVMPEIVDQGFDKMLESVYKTGEPVYAYETPVTLIKNGKPELMHYTFIYQAQYNADGEIEGVAVIANEVTPQVELNKKIRESEQNFRQLADLLPEKVTNTDAEGNVTYYNQNWLEYTGMRVDELTGWGWEKIMHPDDLEKNKELWLQAIAEGKDLVVEERLLNKDGEYKWHLSRVSPVKDNTGKITKWISATTEIQDQKEQKEELEKAVQARTQELKQVNEDLIKTNEELESFTYVASHDLQEPLRKIQTFACRLVDTQKPGEDVKPDLQKIAKAADRMRILIEDLLNYSRIVKGRHLYVDTDLNKIISEGLIDFDLLIAQKKAVINYDALPTIEAIPSQMNQLFCNLISNALKFSKADQVPVINITASRLSQSQLDQYPNLNKELEYFEFIVKDNGIGFNQQYAEQVFTIFQRLNASYQYAGTGIGLAMCRKIVVNHGGEIYAEAQENEGSIFHFILPVKQG